MLHQMVGQVLALYSVLVAESESCESPIQLITEVWNWRLNVEKGIEIFNERVATAGEYPSRVRNSEG
jgi:hypothetical protein